MEMSKPADCASWLRTVAGSWHWSPTITAWAFACQGNSAKSGEAAETSAGLRSIAAVNSGGGQRFNRAPGPQPVGVRAQFLRTPQA